MIGQSDQEVQKGKLRTVFKHFDLLDQVDDPQSHAAFPNFHQEIPKIFLDCG